MSHKLNIYNNEIGKDLYILKKIIKSIFRLLGLSISKSIIKPFVLNELKIGYVIDVGANEGQFIQSIRESGFNGGVTSFEPLTDAHKKLSHNAVKDPKWIIHKRVACGANIGQIIINVAGNSASSSFKKMLPAHLNAAPYSLTVGQEKIDVITLDSEIQKWEKVGAPIFLKIDTQGFEEEVLAGAELTIKLVAAVQIELSLVELYQKQELFDYFLEYFKKREFMLFDVIPGFSDPKTGQLLQFDAVFVKVSYLKKLSIITEL
jgi:FkbM family methyltransferase